MGLSYRGRARALLEEAGAEDYDLLEMRTGSRKLSGILMPRPEILDDEHVVIKLDNGYNMGVAVAKISGVRVLRKGGAAPERRPPAPSAPRGGLPKVSILATGGTIASRVEYSTGAVRPTESPEELLDLIPEMGEAADVSYKSIMAVFSEDISPEDWVEIARAAASELNSGASGVVVAHGTDTMHYTAAALSFLLQNLTKPVILVGAQRSIDRPSTDAVLNLSSAVRMAAYGPAAEVMIVMHGSTSDDFAFAIRGVKARKMHTSRRDAFLPVNEPPIAVISSGGDIEITGRIRRRRGSGKVDVDPRIEPRVALIYAWPSITGDYLRAVSSSGYEGVVIAGTGLGHVPNRIISEIGELVDSGIPVVISSQCLFGRVNLRVYSTGRRLLAAGAIPAGDMLPEVATVKLMVGLGRGYRGDELREFMTSNIAGEISESIPPNSFPPCYRPGAI